MLPLSNRASIVHPSLLRNYAQGIIFSSALLDALPLSQFAACINRTWGTSGSDNLISLCLWDAGHAFVDPGHWLRHKHSLTYVTFVRLAFPHQMLYFLHVLAPLPFPSLILERLAQYNVRG